jgi:hypothetical protein
MALQRWGLPTLRRHDRQSRLEQAPSQCGGALLMSLTFDAARSEVADAGESTRGENQGQRRREDEPGRAAPEEVDQCCRTGM